MNLKKYSWMAVLPLFLSACQEDTLVNNDQQQGIYTLSGKMSAGSPLSRAQIELGNQGLKETAFWNEGDSFGLIQESDGNYTEKVFTISSDYKEATAEDKSTALFTTTTPVISDSKYVAVYPAGKTIEGRTIILGLESTLTFSPTMSDETVWKNYFKNNMYMMASGTLESQNPSVEFKHLCALARVTYTNKSGVAQTISRLSLGGDQLLNNMVAYDLIEDKCYPKNPTSDLFLNTNNLTVANDASTDLYMFFFPSEFGTGNLMITIKDNDDNLKTVSLPVADIQGANDGATGFEAGKRYWFKVTETETGLAWSKDCMEKTAEVTDLTGLKQAMQDETVTHIALQNPIVIDSELGNNNHKTILPSKKSFTWNLNGVEEDALFIVNGFEFMNLSNFTIQGEANESDGEKYLLKNATGNVFYSNINFDAKGTMNAVRVENSIFHLCDNASVDVESENGYAISVLSENDTRADVYMHAGTVNGNVHFHSNYYNTSYNQNRLTIEAGTVKGKLEITGKYGYCLNVSVWEAATADGAGWETITINNLELSRALNGLYLQDLNSENLVQIATAKAGAFTELNFSDTSYTITSLDGVDAFYNLESLYCSGTSLTGDLKISNKKLNKLELSNNNLTYLRVNGLTELEELDCSNNPELGNNIKIEGTSLKKFRFHHTGADNQNDIMANYDVSTIEVFDCGNNDFTSLDFIGYTSLKEVHASCNQLTSDSFVLPASDKLTWLDLTSNKNITSIDLTQYPNLEYFYNQQNNVTSLDVTKCPNLCLLYTNGNKLSELDLTQNKKLQLLFCDGQQDDIVLKLKLPEHLMDKWNNEWKDSFYNVVLDGEGVNLPSLPKEEW